AGVDLDDTLDGATVASLAASLGVEEVYALLSFTARPRSDEHEAEAIAQLGLRLPAPTSTPEYLPLELTQLPEIAKPKVEPRRLSTGQMPLEIAQVGSAWRMRCTGCGQASAPVQFRWQVLDQTVACRCA
ncbi:MAG TPA: hypothetical protein VFZ17_07930, partial [Acidimicrobiia bacterium]|nr:hypothetical protein [Acidimicrobiia bacterium]